MWEGDSRSDAALLGGLIDSGNLDQTAHTLCDLIRAMLPHPVIPKGKSDFDVCAFFPGACVVRFLHAKFWGCVTSVTFSPLFLELLG